MIGLTDRQLVVLQAIHEITATRGFPPTLRDIQTRFGFRSVHGAHDHVVALRRKGALAEAPKNRKRALVLTDRGRELVGEPPAANRASRDVTAPRILAPVLQPFRCGVCSTTRFDATLPCPTCSFTR